MLMTFFKWPFLTKGNKAAMTLFTPITLVFKVSPKSFLFGHQLVVNPVCGNLLGYGHIHDSVRGCVHDAGAIDETVETLAIERLLHRLSSLFCTLLGCDLERDKLHAAVGAVDQLLQVIRLLAGGCKHFGHLG